MNLTPLLYFEAALALATAAMTQAQIAPAELVAPQFGISGGSLIFTVRPSVSGRTYQVQFSDTMAAGTWQNLGAVANGTGSNLAISTNYVPSVTRRFYRLLLASTSSSAPAGFALIPAGEFQMGDALDGMTDAPVHNVYVSAFYMEQYEVTKALWDEVKAWGGSQYSGYAILPVGEGKSDTHPVTLINWYAVVKWCNARSEKEGLTPCYTVASTGAVRWYSDVTPLCNWSANGYRLPTEAEWEKAARGGMVGKRFAWGDVISHTYANYYNYNYSYESPQNQGCHPTYYVGASPYTAPVGSFGANGYGLYDMAGNVKERCWELYSSSYYTVLPRTDPRGDPSIDVGAGRVIRGGSWGSDASLCRLANRDRMGQLTYSNGTGFRVVRSVAP